MNAASVGVTYTEWTALTDAQQADKLANSNTKGIIREDQALILLNAFKFTPKTISTDGSTINRVDTSIYSAISPDSEVYIGPPDGTYENGESFCIVRIIRTLTPGSTSHQVW